MENKKSKKADIELKKGLFLQIGLVVTLLVMFFAFEWKSYDKSLTDLGNVSLNLEEEEAIITQRPPDVPPPPPPVAPTEQIVVADNTADIKEEIQIQSMETSSTEVIEVQEVQVVDQVKEEVFNFQVVEDKPVFPGCERFAKNAAKVEQCFNDKMKDHIMRNFQYPEVAREMNVQGRVIIKFVIEKSGKIGGIEVLRGVDKNLDSEAIRIVSKLPAMQPAKQRAKPVAVSYQLPIIFKLANQ